MRDKVTHFKTLLGNIVTALLGKCNKSIRLVNAETFHHLPPQLPPLLVIPLKWVGYYHVPQHLPLPWQHSAPPLPPLRLCGFVWSFTRLTPVGVLPHSVTAKMMHAHKGSFSERLSTEHVSANSTQPYSDFSYLGSIKGVGIGNDGQEDIYSISSTPTEFSSQASVQENSDRKTSNKIASLAKINTT